MDADGLSGQCDRARFLKQLPAYLRPVLVMKVLLGDTQEAQRAKAKQTLTTTPRGSVSSWRSMGGVEAS